MQPTPNSHRRYCDRFTRCNGYHHGRHFLAAFGIGRIFQIITEWILKTAMSNESLPGFLLVEPKARREGETRLSMLESTAAR